MWSASPDEKMNADIKSIIVLLATQAMINMGEITDPLSNTAKCDQNGSLMFLQLLDALEEKTKGNLTPDEAAYLANIRENLDKIYNKKFFTDK